MKLDETKALRSLRPISHNYNTEKYTVTYCSLDIFFSKGTGLPFLSRRFKKEHFKYNWYAL